MVQVLLDYGVDVNAQNNLGSTPLTLASGIISMNMTPELFGCCLTTVQIQIYGHGKAKPRCIEHRKMGRLR